MNLNQKFDEDRGIGLENVIGFHNIKPEVQCSTQQHLNYIEPLSHLMDLKIQLQQASNLSTKLLNAPLNTSETIFSFIQQAIDKSMLNSSMEIITNIKVDDQFDSNLIESGKFDESFLNEMDHQYINETNYQFNLIIPTLLPPYLNLHYLYECGSRLLFLSIYWFKKITPFKLLNDELQNELIKRSWVEIFIIGLAQCSKKLSIQTILTTLINQIKAAILHQSSTTISSQQQTSTSRNNENNPSTNLECEFNQSSQNDESNLCNEINENDPNTENKTNDDDSYDNNNNDDHFPIKDKKNDGNWLPYEHINKLSSDKIRRITEHIIKIQNFIRSITQLDLDEYEYAYFRLICLFNSGLYDFVFL